MAQLGEVMSVFCIGVVRADTTWIRALRIALYLSLPEVLPFGSNTISIHRHIISVSKNLSVMDT